MHQVVDSRAGSNSDARAVSNVHIGQGLVDDYAALLRLQIAGKSVKILDSIQWTQLHTVSEERFTTLAALFCGRDGKKFKSVDRIIWPVVGRNHYAVLDIHSNGGVNINVYDSVQSMAPGWITDRLKILLTKVFPTTTTLNIRYPECHQQVNADDCGIFAMAHMRCLVEGGDISSISKDATSLRKQFASELLKSK